MAHCNSEALLRHALELQEISQTGLSYAECDFDIQRYKRLQAIAIELLACFTHAPVETIQNYIWPQKGYPTPKVEVRIGVVDRGKILLARERDDQRWALPGGWADSWLSPIENARKELQEETGLTVQAVELIGLLDSRRCLSITNTPMHAYTLMFRGLNPEGEFKCNVETSETGWFSVDSLPPLSAHRTTIDDIHMVLGDTQYVVVA